MNTGKAQALEIYKEIESERKACRNCVSSDYNGRCIYDQCKGWLGPKDKAHPPTGPNPHSTGQSPLVGAPGPWLARWGGFWIGG